MRGWDVKSDALFSYVSCEARVPKDHPLRPIRQIVDKALATLSPEFEKLYAKLGRPSIPPERLLRALLLQAFYSVRSELQLMEQLDYNLLFRWFVGLSLDEAVWDETVFTKNRERLIEGDIARRFMAAVLNQEPVKALLSDDHFSVDGTLIEAWASMKSFRPKDGGGEPPAPGRNGERDRLARANAGAPGVDEVTFAQIEEQGLERWLAGLREELVSKTYRPDSVRRVMIPKHGGGERPLGIPSIRDCVIQTAAKIVLEPIFEADFEDNAYGYRPARGAVDAVKDVHRHLCRGYTDVVDADLSRYLGSLDDLFKIVR